MTVEFHQFEYFKVVAKHQNFSKAAAELHVSQSALSRSIAKLESELNVTLFDRNGKRIALNDNGVRFLADVERILAEIDDSVRAISSANIDSHD